MKTRFISMALCIVLILCLFPLAAAAYDYRGASAWAEPELEKAAGYGLITDRVKVNLSANITREELAEIAVKLYELYTGKKAQAGSASFTDTTNPEILKAAELGLVLGVGGGKYAPNQLVNREQMATILLRALKVINPGADYSTAGAVKFADDKNIESWAQDGVYYCSKAGLIKGIGGNMFNPKGNSTREAAVIVCTRAYGLYKQAGDSGNSGSAQGTQANTNFSNDILKQNMEKLDSYRRKVKTVTTATGTATGEKSESVKGFVSDKEFAYVRNPVSRHTKLDFPGSGSYNEEIIIGDKLWDRTSKDGKWTAWDSYETEKPVTLKYDVSTQYYPIDYQKLAFVKSGTEKVNGVNCIKYTVSGTYTDVFSDDFSSETPIKLTASGNIWIADDPAIKLVIIRQRITVDADITADTTHIITKDVIEDDVTDINSTVIQPPSV